MASRTALERLWRVPVYLPYLQPPLTDLDIAQAEARLGVRLPRAYLEALRLQNGGYVRLSAHPCGHAPVDCLAGIGPRFPSLLHHDWSDTRRHMADQGICRPDLIDDLIPFAGDGHRHYCFDYRTSGRQGEPRVTYVDVESFDVDEVLAPDFATFLGQLRAEDHGETFGLVTSEPIDTLAAALSRATGFPFDDRGDQDHGYRVFRAKLPGTAQWAWLEANRTRRGFVRRTDRDHPELSHLLPELVDRHPEHHDCGAFLTCTDFKGGAGQAIKGSLAKLPFPSRAVQLDGD